MLDYTAILQEVTFNADGLVPVIVQDVESNEVLMMAWMNREALEKTLTQGTMCYWSRSRQKLWVKGETSGQVQHLKELAIDCDGDALLAKVIFTGVACHTGRRSCFYQSVCEGKLMINQDVVVPPEELYEK